MTLVHDTSTKSRWVNPGLMRLNVESTLTGNPNANGETFSNDNAETKPAGGPGTFS